MLYDYKKVLYFHWLQLNTKFNDWHGKNLRLLKKEPFQCWPLCCIVLFFWYYLLLDGWLTVWRLARAVNYWKLGRLTVSSKRIMIVLPSPWFHWLKRVCFGVPHTNDGHNPLFCLSSIQPPPPLFFLIRRGCFFLVSDAYFRLS